MGEPTLFDVAPDAQRRVAAKYPGWVQTLKHASGKGGRWEHPASGWVLTHCGHPTAIYPYALHSPDHPGCAIVSHNGMGFKRLPIAVDVHRRILAGELHPTTDRCGPRTVRVMDVDAGGERVPR